MPSALEFLAPLRAGLIPLPATNQSGVCEICHTGIDADYVRCSQCEQARYLAVPEVLPIAMSVHLGLLHAHLRGYKDNLDTAVRSRMALRLAALVSVFMANHQRCLGEWDYVTCVPSVRRAAPAAIVSHLGVFAPRYNQVLAASAEVRRAERALDPGRFPVSGRVRRDRVLLFDDTFTSGASIFSAVAALREAGAEVVGPLVIGRHIRPDWGPSQALLYWLAQRKWDEHRCARCGGEYRAQPAPGALF
jgi:predicted amidophosphoribosyltransferase